MRNRLQSSFKAALLSLLIMTLFGCTALQVAIEKRDLAVETQMSDTIFLEPVGPSLKSVFLQIRNTSDKQGIQLTDPIRKQLRAKGYTITQEPDEAQYILQVNILQAGKNDETSADEAVASGFGSAIIGGLAGAAIGDSSEAAAAGAIVGGAADFLSSAFVKDVTYTLTTDIQISEKSRAAVTTKGSQKLRQGTRGVTTQHFQETLKRKTYQTRIVSRANKVNLSFEEALPELQAGLIQSLSGLF